MTIPEAEAVEGQQGDSEFPAVNAVREFLKKKEEADIEFSKDTEKAKLFLSQMASLIEGEEMDVGSIVFQGENQRIVLQIQISPNGTENRFFFWKPAEIGTKEEQRDEVERRQLLLPADTKIILEMSEMTEIVLVRD